MGAMATTGALPLAKAFQLMRASKAAPALYEVPAELRGFRPTAHEFNPVAPRDPAAGLTPEEAAKMRKLISGSGGEPGAVGTSGGSAPKPIAKGANIPAYRSKSGMAVDTLEDMKKATTPSQIGGDPVSHADRFEYFLSKDASKRSPTGWEDNIGYEGPSGSNLSEEQVGALLGNEARRDRGKPFMVSEDPVRYVGHLKGADDTMGFREPSDIALDKEVFGKEIPHPQMVDKLIQDLADYFSTSKFDPFSGEAAEIRGINPSTNPTSIPNLGQILKDIK
jgi:hypothetical protein